MARESEYSDWLFPREQDIDVQLGDELPDSPIVSVSTDGDSVYVQYGHENVGSVVVRLSAANARRLGWMLTAASTVRERYASVDYVLTDKGREAVDA